MKEQQPNIIYIFGDYRVDALRRQLLLNDRPLALTAKAFDTLLLLISRCGKILSKDELMLAVWPDTVVEENNLIQQVSALRKAFGERAGDHSFIVTVPGRGYTFVMPVVQEIAGAGITNDLSDDRFRRRPFMALLDRSTLTGYALAFSLMIVVASGFVWSYIANAGGAARPRSLAVLKFRSLGMGDEVIGSGISETLRARLGSVEDLTIQSTGTSLTDQDALSAGRQLHVEAVVTGSVQRDKDRIRVAVEMLNVADGRVVWGKTFDEQSSDIFALQDSIAGEIARALQVRFSSQRDDKRRQDIGSGIDVFHRIRSRRQDLHV